MSTEPSPAAETDKKRFQFTQRQSIGLVFGATVFNSAAQMLIKTGANNLESASPLDMLMNPPVFFGYALYGLFTVFMVLALRDGELSILYPVISLSYAWVTILSVWLLDEKLNVFKVAGIVVIILGVAVLGRNKRT